MFMRRVQQTAARAAQRSMSIARPAVVNARNAAAVSSFQRIPARLMSSVDGDVGSLSEVLADELQEEIQNDEINQEFLDIKNQIAKTFKIQETAGSGVVTLTHSNAKEVVEVVFDCQDEVEDEEDMSDFEGEEHQEHDHDHDHEDEDMGPGMGVKFHVTVNKKNGTGDKIVFYCVAGQQVNIENVQYLPAGKAIEDTTLYHGPLFDKLSDSLRESMLGYLADRGVDDDMAFFVMAYSENKEQREYVHWLKKMMTFVDTK